ncbi:DUF1905 domain-containing protein [Cellulomonas carbonis]|uniref:DUF1905 domain-containing protein n=1 Tax=Cellulomonas carbonis T26 TaxID=947969 RepID=A0A0A0BUP4_9CELL|nr:DUF1905 domain-containing protein [Cellulomonas carbonis]KGM11685.1 hypothetical protein N868_07940 [Cellulomonas carbonis T26]GGB99192.1 hypothetical protein GCM10010972_10030 [Cellulomonas carbonis]
MDHSFTGELWLWDARRVDTWTFVSLPSDLADEILDTAGALSRGFGSLRVEVAVGTTVWRTSIFPDSARRTYVLPVKKAVRAAERLSVGDPVPVRLRLLDLDAGDVTAARPGKGLDGGHPDGG